jgi:hypothetical protein
LISRLFCQIDRQFTLRNAWVLRHAWWVQTSFKYFAPEPSLSALCRALAPAEVRVSYCVGQALPFRVDVPSLGEGSVSYRGETAEAAAHAALQQTRGRGPRLVAMAVEPSGEGPYAEAVREWIEQVTPATPLREPPLLRIVR